MRKGLQQLTHGVLGSLVWSGKGIGGLQFACQRCHVAPLVVYLMCPSKAFPRTQLYYSMLEPPQKCTCACHHSVLGISAIMVKLCVEEESKVVRGSMKLVVADLKSDIVFISMQSWGYMLRDWSYMRD